MKAHLITTANLMPATITTVKAALFLLALLCAGLQWTGLRSHLSYQSYHYLVEEIGNGRLLTEDASWVEEALETPVVPSSLTSPQLLRSATLIHMYNVDLVATSKGISPVLPSQDPDLSIARLDAMKRLKANLSRSPTDGDLWLRLALIERAESPSDNASNHYLRLSQKTAPHEGWIQNRRAALTQ